MSESLWLSAGVFALILIAGMGLLAGYWLGRYRRLESDIAVSAHQEGGVDPHSPTTSTLDVTPVTNPTEASGATSATASVLAAPRTSPTAATPSAEQHPAAPSLAEEIAAFSYTVTHDLRAPLRVIDGFSRILKEDYGKHFDRMALDHLDRVLGATARMNAMIDAMMAQARLSTQPLSRELVDLSQMAQGIAEDLRRQAPERQVDFQIETGLEALGDPTLLRQVLDNLLSNAWKYSGQQTNAVIAFRRESTGQESPAFVVSDNGAGFDMKSAERLFGLFQRLHSASEFPGNGVGLASVQRIIRRHGGRIWAEAEPQRGARFHFTLGN